MLDEDCYDKLELDGYNLTVVRRYRTYISYTGEWGDVCPVRPQSVSEFGRHYFENNPGSEELIRSLDGTGTSLILSIPFIAEYKQYM